MRLTRIFALASLAVCNVLVKKEMELYNALDPEFILALRDGVLMFINVETARLQNASTVFTTDNSLLKQGTAAACSDGITGKVLRLCSFGGDTSYWRLKQVPNEYEVFELRNWDGTRCAVYGILTGKELTIEVGPCVGQRVMFKALDMGEYLTEGYENKMAAGLRYSPNPGMGVFPEPRLGNRHYEPLIPERFTANM